MHHLGGVGTEKVRLAISRDLWCVEILTAVADRTTHTKKDLLLLRLADLGQISHEQLELRLSALQTARMLKIDGEIVMITPLGFAAASYLAGRRQQVDLDDKAPPNIVMSIEADDEEPLSAQAKRVSEDNADLATQDARLAKPPFTHRAHASRSEGQPNKTNEGRYSSDGRLARTERRSSLLRFLNMRRSDNSVRPHRQVAAGRYFATVTIAVCAVIMVVSSYFVSGMGASSGSYRFANIQRADLTISTIATGQVRAIDAVEVSSQLSGQVVRLFANFNDEVKAGAPLAQIDDKIFQATVVEAKARVAHAQASYDSAVAAIAGAAARYDEALKDFGRKQSLAKKGNMSAQDVEKAQANLLTAESEHNAALADEAVQKASIQMAEASLRKAEIDLERTVIRSPIDGVIIRRSVELGQTVAASMEAPTLFTIAQELSEMQVHARIDEADIGQIRVGQRSSFSVDAYPGRTFSGQVVEVHRAPESIQNVVTYTVVITAINPELSLLPGMTALVSIVTTERPDALLVPNAALRFSPNDLDRTNQDGSLTEMNGGHPHVWVGVDKGDLKQVQIDIGASDGVVTEVVSGDLAEAQKVAIGQQRPHADRSLFGLRLGF